MYVVISNLVICTPPFLWLVLVMSQYFSKNSRWGRMEIAALVPSALSSIVHYVQQLAANYCLLIYYPRLIHLLRPYVR
jgi:hypothetical protein